MTASDKCRDLAGSGKPGTGAEDSNRKGTHPSDPTPSPHDGEPGPYGVELDERVNAPTRVLVADGHALTTDTLVEYLRRRLSDAGVEGVTSMDRVYRLLDEGPVPGLALLDTHLLGTEGTEAIVALRQRSPGIRVVLMAEGLSHDMIRTALTRGAAGVISKSISGEAMIKVLELVLAGETYAPPLLGLGDDPGIEAADGSDFDPTGTPAQFRSLTPRERQVLTLILRGHPNKQIAHELNVKEITVAFHLRGLFKKLGVSNRTQAATKALQSGWTGGRGGGPDKIS